MGHLKKYGLVCLADHPERPSQPASQPASVQQACAGAGRPCGRTLRLDGGAVRQSVALVPLEAVQVAHDGLWFELSLRPAASGRYPVMGRDGKGGIL